MQVAKENSSLLFSAYKLSRKNTQTENMCDIVLEKTKDRGVFMQKQASEGFFRKGVMSDFAEFTRKHLCRNLFFCVFL